MIINDLSFQIGQQNYGPYEFAPTWENIRNIPIRYNYKNIIIENIPTNIIQLDLDNETFNQNNIIIFTYACKQDGINYIPLSITNFSNYSISIEEELEVGENIYIIYGYISKPIEVVKE